MKLISLNAYFGYVFEPFMSLFSVNPQPRTCLLSESSNPKEDAAELMPRSRHLLQESRASSKILSVFLHRCKIFDFVPSYPGQMQLGIAVFTRRFCL